MANSPLLQGTYIIKIIRYSEVNIQYQHALRECSCLLSRLLQDNLFNACVIWFVPVYLLSGLGQSRICGVIGVRLTKCSSFVFERRTGELARNPLCLEVGDFD
jgi:hypothetical protein